MAAPTPETLRAGRHCLIVLERVLQAAEPLEGCALLLGRRQDSDLELERIWPCCNRWEPAFERDHRFALDPREQLLAQRWGRERGLVILGSAHSHPCSAALPSPTDLQWCCGPTLMLIRSGLAPADAQDHAAATPPQLRAWWLADGTGWGNSDPLPVAAVSELRIAIHDACSAEASGHLGE